MPKTLLLADDSVTIQKVVGISFANEDVELVTVDNGDDAIARARETRPDAVLADVVMPGKTGYEVCETIKSDPDLQHIPVLLLTGTFEAFDEERARRVGADGHVTKPFEAQRLVERVNGLLASAPAAAAEPAQAADEPAAAAASEDAGDAYDFLDEDPLAATSAQQETAQDAEDQAFVFESEEIPASSVDPRAESGRAGFGGSAPDATMALMPEGDEEVDAADSLLDEGDLTEPDFSETQTRAVFLEPPEAPAAKAQGPGDTQVTEAPVEEPEDTDSGPDEADELLGDSEDVVAQPSEAATAWLPEADGEAEEDDLELGLDATEALQDIPEEPPERRSEFDVSSSDLSASSVRTLRQDPFASSGPGAQDLDPVRAKLMESLEKIAWEAFGDLADQLVKQTVARVEAIAWDVIPQMAESLIREEIRKLQEEE